MTRGGETPEIFPALVENLAGRGRFVLVCEHASNDMPPQWGSLGLTADQRRGHIAWDIGALGLARGLARRLDAVLVHAPVSRLVYDCNRAPDQPGAMAERSEMHAIPGNAGLDAQEKALRTTAVYAPFHAGLRAEIVRRIALGLEPVLVTVHSFTPVWHGVPRAVEFGIIHDEDDRLARAVLEAAGGCGLVAGLNEPYSAADDVTHTLRLQALPYGLLNVMLEIRNDLIDRPEAQEAMAERLAPVLERALAAVARPAMAG
ncbi:N-formylglutamate amidohydrolase [Cereibacter sphaeroides]|uniref:N-formylglutamate amidohydrolase n=1 Tax=Cereibacter sphaeroides TaxID=1063 RepID=UPI001F27F8CB|nr:N-formylglutamate amidohydrolase [Cereibacter sphaeroides]MCE6961411.1 N-formylglutamate amidohydrolase [Cereibacter sphaeroides]MCE6970397.1 N-formylglutamate amidohydrolase [Cereibacter sphaeroides]MCE6973908.1 N-formylglutamate amidohydrolase [Cereibacter sphaeroides]